MCGRYTVTAGATELIETFDVPELSFEHHPRYNVAPSQDAPVVASDRHGRRIGLMRWGFEPAGALSGRGVWINARAESVARRATFREAFRRRRCLVPADGFYEWRREGRGRIPYWFHARDRGLFSLAGIWEGRTFAILTTDANDDVRAVHDRMPVVVAPGERAAWMDRDAPPEILARMLGPAPAGTFESWAVSGRVNRPDPEGPSLIEPV
jgi:putative SOS response-associated peptidase YedK